MRKIREWLAVKPRTRDAAGLQAALDKARHRRVLPQTVFLGPAEQPVSLPAGTTIMGSDVMVFGRVSPAEGKDG